MDARPPLNPEEAAQHAESVRALARRLLRDGGAAEDAAQETWLVALEGARRGDVPLSWWLRGVVRNVARHFRRAEGRRKRHETAAARPEAVTAESSVERAEMHRRLVDAVLALEEPYRTTVLARYFDELSCAQIARRDGVPEGTVRSRLKRGLDALRTRLDREHASGRAAWAVLLAPFALRRGGKAPLLRLPTRPLAAPIAAAALIALLVVGARTVASASERAARTAAVAAETHDAAQQSIDSGTSAVERRRRGRSEDAATAQDAPAADPAAPRLRGAVVLVDGTPVPGARVDVYRHGYEDEQKPLLQTDADAVGAFDVAVEGGQWRWTSAAADGLFGGARVTPGTPTSVVLRKTAPCRVRVVDAVDRPIEGAAVMWVLVEGGNVSAAWRLATTDADGIAEPDIPGAAAGAPCTPVVIVRAAGYRKALFFGATSLPPRVEMARARRVAGRIVDSAGRPIAKTVQVNCGDTGGGFDGGVFAFDAVLVHGLGRVSLGAWAEGYCGWGGEVAAGDERIVITLLRPRTLRVTLRRADGSVPSGAGVVLWDERYDATEAGVVVIEGVSPGETTLIGVEGTSEAPTLAAETRLFVAESDAPLDLAMTLLPAAVSFAPVEVVERSGAPLPDCRVGLAGRSDDAEDRTDERGRAVVALRVPPGSPVELEATRHPDGTTPPFGSVRAKATTRASRHDLEAPTRLVPNEVVRVVVEAVNERGEPRRVSRVEWDGDAVVDPAAPSVLSARAGSKLRLRVLSDGGGFADLEVVAPDSGETRVTATVAREGEVKMRVLDEKGGPTGAVYVAVRSQGRQFVGGGTPDPDGTLVAGGVQAGPVRVLVSRRPGGPVEAHADFVLAPAETRDLGALRLSGLTWLRGCVRDVGGRALVGAQVSFAVPEALPSLPGTTTSGDGTFELAVAVGARGTLSASCDGYAPGAAAVDVDRGREGVLVELSPAPR